MNVPHSESGQDVLDAEELLPADGHGIVPGNGQFRLEINAPGLGGKGVGQALDPLIALPEARKVEVEILLFGAFPILRTEGAESLSPVTPVSIGYFSTGERK
jgi:hypothetical protein